MAQIWTAVWLLEKLIYHSTRNLVNQQKVFTKVSILCKHFNSALCFQNLLTSQVYYMPACDRQQQMLTTFITFPSYLMSRLLIIQFIYFKEDTAVGIARVITMNPLQCLLLFCYLSTLHKILVHLELFPVF